MAVALVASVLALATPAGAKQSVSTVRVSGADRYLTSTTLSTSAGVAGANATHFVLVNGTSYADALSAAALAGTKQGSIILLPADGTISATATARMAAATNITIVGGYASLPASVETTMKTLRAAATISRIAGADRYATAAAVAQNILTGNIAAVNGKKSAFLASGTSFADAVIAAPGAYAGPTNSASTAVVPIMLTATDSLSAPTKAQMSLLGIKQVFVLGGTAVVSAATAAEVTALGISVIRLSGANRYATAVAIADKFTAKTTAGGWGFDDDDIGLVNLEQSGGGADALAASAYLGQSNAPALGAGANGLSAETSAWLTAHNGSTGVSKIHAIGGTSAVSAAQLTAADAAGTIAGPVATITASPGQSSVTIAFSQTVTSTSASLATGYSIMGASAPAIDTVTYSSTKNTVTLALGAALETGDIVRVNAGIISTAAGLTVSLTDTTVGTDSTVPTCTVYASTGNDDITITCDELVKQVGTLDTDVDTKVTVGGVALGTASATGSGGAALSTASKTVAIDDDANFTSTGAAIVIQKDLLQDLAGNKVPQLTGTVVTDTTKPTVVGLPTYTLTAKTKASKLLGPADAQVLFVANSAGIGGNTIQISTVDDSRAAATMTVTVTNPTASTSLITITGDLNGSGASAGPTSATTVAAVNAHATAKGLVTAYVAIGDGTTLHDTAYTTQALAGGTTTLTVSTTFSEAVTVGNVNMIEYDVADDGANQEDSATSTCVGSACTSTWTLTGATNLTAPAVNVDSIMYGAGITDLALNTLTAVSPFLAAP
jgi:putative cell wall-binding protein